MVEVKPLSGSKLVAAVGGGLLVAAFFLPLASEQGRSDAQRELFGVRGLRAQIEAQRDLVVVQPLIEPALQAIERFVAMPSLRNLSTVAAASTELLDTAADLGAPQAREMRQAAKLLGIARICLWWLPLVGAVQVLVPLATRLRGYAGVFGLLARYVCGLGFALVALVPVVGAPEQQDNFGPAVWALLAGSMMMMAASLAGVTRRNWWVVLLADVVISVAVIGGLVALAESLPRR